MSVDEVRAEVEKLGPFERGQVVVVRTRSMSKDELDELALWLASTCDDPPLVVRLDHEADLSVLTEVDMNEAGWFRSGTTIIREGLTVRLLHEGGST